MWSKCVFVRKLLTSIAERIELAMFSSSPFDISATSKSIASLFLRCSPTATAIFSLTNEIKSRPLANIDDLTKDL